MAILHPATLKPSKIELLAAHLMKSPSLADTPASDFSQLGAYRFDDPAGKVGMESHLVSAAPGRVFHAPLTYREAPLIGADEWLISTMEHSVLGTRWIYNACGDVVYVRELVRAILTGGSEVEQFVETDNGPVLRPSTATVVGSGVAGSPVPEFDSVTGHPGVDETMVSAGGLEIVIRHSLAEPMAAGPRTLSGTWPQHDQPTILAFIR